MDLWSTHHSFIMKSAFYVSTQLLQQYHLNQNRSIMMYHITKIEEIKNI
jgi:hypothetical protein